MQSIVDKKKIKIDKMQCLAKLCSEGTLTMDILKHYTNLQYVAVQ